MLTVDDLRGLTLRQLDVICSAILAMPPPHRPAACCAWCERENRRLFGPPEPPSDTQVTARARLRARRLSALLDKVTIPSR